MMALFEKFENNESWCNSFWGGGAKGQVKQCWLLKRIQPLGTMTKCFCQSDQNLKPSQDVSIVIWNFEPAGHKIAKNPLITMNICIKAHGNAQLSNTLKWSLEIITLLKTRSLYVDSCRHRRVAEKYAPSWWMHVVACAHTSLCIWRDGRSMKQQCFLLMYFV